MRRVLGIREPHPLPPYGGVWILRQPVVQPAEDIIADTQSHGDGGPRVDVLDRITRIGRRPPQPAFRDHVLGFAAAAEDGVSDPDQPRSRPVVSCRELGVGPAAAPATPPSCAAPLLPATLPSGGPASRARRHAKPNRYRTSRSAPVLPGVAPSPPIFVPGPVNEMLFHLMFNRLPMMNDQLVHGREDIFFGFIFDVEAFNKLPSSAVRVYIDNLADSLASLLGSFGFYRAVDTTTAQNQQRAKTPLTLPVLAIGGAESAGTAVGEAMMLAATNVQTLVIRSCGHFVPDEAPKQLLAALIPFLTA